MHEYTQDAMTYMLGHIFACNHTWEEIKELFLPILSSSNRHDITALIFKTKIKMFT
jgi:hypothetical protein